MLGVSRPAAISVAVNIPPPSKPRVALIAGPTASGKSALAIELAERIGGTVVNADASQVYRDLRVLSARPDAADVARVPHRLFGHVDGSVACSAADWAAQARDAIDAIHAEGGVPVLVGGTGLYLRTLLDGIAPVPAIDPAVREAVRALPVAAAYDALRREDPTAAARLNAGDTTRVARALEVVRATGRTLADWQEEKSGGIADHVALSPMILLPDRAELMDRCDRRLVEMFDGGAVEEVAALLVREDVPADAPVRRAIGVPDIAAYLSGELSRDDALARAQLSTRRYAKRQYTWFRHQPPAAWPRCAAATSQYYVADSG
ncbi:tRNA dimethylallyltransferase [Sphingomonas sp. Leaf412]|uniref:tRNA (adenosine(37)-N6)-dimethylallyltransferase MiaA n=1 Tax=Sphingomonas sp. Leaf412 TaxID=1736370 RepID=UPI0006F8A79E|nr:tRNA (adenosine(37)-N6)-dimethylallyltransferase MiaA [Sphingomonas sp. Leaf412]KQT32256.1 tRNA dimethylallyltransferase [Sphingomonas sp. Leaf412]